MGGALLNSDIGVELEHGFDVFQRVLFHRCPLSGGATRSQGGLDLIGLEDALEIGVGHDRSRHGEALLVGRRVHRVQLGEGRGGPDAKSADVATWGEFEEVELVNGEEGDAGDVAEGEGDSVVLIVDDEGTALLDVASVSHFTATGTKTAGVLHTLDIGPGLQVAENTDCFLCL